MKRRGPKKPAGEMTTDEAAERIFGRRVMRRVGKELEEPQVPKKPKKSGKRSTIKEKDTG